MSSEEKEHLFQRKLNFSFLEHNSIPAVWLRHRLDQNLRRWEREQQPPYHIFSNNASFWMRAELETPICPELETIFGHWYHHTIVIDGASDFDGTHDYPTISLVEDAARRNAYSFFLSHKIARPV
jgi:hypothetical protein